MNAESERPDDDSSNAKHFDVTQRDAELFDRFLRSFVPPDAFDAHLHLFDKAHVKEGTYDDSYMAAAPQRAGFQVYRDQVSLWMGDRTPTGGLLMGMPNANLDADRANRFVAEEAAASESLRWSMVIQPDHDPDEIDGQIEALAPSDRPCGFKVYAFYVDRPDIYNAGIGEFLPEWAWRISDKRGMAIMLHMVKSRAVADTGNQFWIRTYCERYPEMKMILAHAARSFNPNHAIEGMESLRGLPNLWCDMAAVTDVGACEAIIDTLGSERLLWGTDFPISHGRSRCVAVGDAFLWLTPENVTGQQHLVDVEGSFVFHGLESLRVLKQAAWHRRLSDSQVEDIFFGNLAGMLGIVG